MVIEAIKGRRSIRIFQDKEVEDEKLKRLIDAAQWAPSACNKQLWEFVVVSSSKTKERIVNEAKSVRFIKRSPLVIFVLYPRNVNQEHAANIQSAAAAIENMLLAAHQEGLGSVWVADCGKREVLYRILGIPQRFLIVSAVCLGYPERIPPAPMRRGLEEIIHYERYKEKDPKIGYSCRDWSAKAIEDYRKRGIRATSPFPDFFENLSDEKEFRKEIDFACRYIKPSDKVLDVLSFSGNHILEIMREKNLPQVSVHDISDEIRYFLEERKERLCIEGELNFSQGGLTSLSYPSNSFDVVTCFKKLNLVSNPEELLKEMVRVLKKDSLLILTFWNYCSLSGLNYFLRNELLNHRARITNEGLVKPIFLMRMRKALSDTGLEVVAQTGARFWPGIMNRLPGVKQEWFNKNIYQLCCTICMLCKRTSS